MIKVCAYHVRENGCQALLIGNVLGKSYLQSGVPRSGGAKWFPSSYAGIPGSGILERRAGLLR